jgi:hypothetical protein
MKKLSGAKIGMDNIGFKNVSCGNNMHQICFDEWAKSKKAKGEQTTCVYCRAPWDAPKSKPGKADTNEGYVNLAKYQPGVSSHREFTYHDWESEGSRRWGRRRWRYDEEEGNSESEGESEKDENVSSDEASQSNGLSEASDVEDEEGDHSEEDD